VFPSGSSETDALPLLLTGFRGSVSLLSNATLRALRLPLSMGEPDWIREFRKNAYQVFNSKPLPTH
jgi:hypothetical protein